MGRTEVSIRQTVTRIRVRGELLAGAMTLAFGLVCLGAVLAAGWVLGQMAIADPQALGITVLCLTAVVGGIYGVVIAWQELDGLMDRLNALLRPVESRGQWPSD